MLTITPTAAEAIEIVVGANEEISDGGGVRIAHQPPGDDGQVHLALTLVEAPEPGDQVVEEDNASVFLTPEAATLLDDKVLDAVVEGEQVGFQVLEQGQEPPS